VCIERCGVLQRLHRRRKGGRVNRAKKEERRRGGQDPGGLTLLIGKVGLLEAVAGTRKTPQKGKFSKGRPSGSKREKMKKSSENLRVGAREAKAWEMTGS